MRKARLIGAVFSLTFSMAIFLAGCGGESGPETYPVTGTITLDGEPVEKGRIVLRDVEGKIPSASGKIENGKFSFQSQPGKKRVQILANREIPGKFDTSNPGEKVPIVEQYIPRKFNVDSELTEEVKAQENEFTFDLKSEDT